MLVLWNENDHFVTRSGWPIWGAQDCDGDIILSDARSTRQDCWSRLVWNVCGGDSSGVNRLGNITNARVRTRHRRHLYRRGLRVVRLDVTARLHKEG